MTKRNSVHEHAMRGIHGDLATSMALINIGSVLDDHAYHVDLINQKGAELGAYIVRLEKRIESLEHNKNNDNDDLMRALVDADNALQKAINHFRATADKK